MKVSIQISAFFLALVLLLSACGIDGAETSATDFEPADETEPTATVESETTPETAAMSLTEPVSELAAESVAEPTSELTTEPATASVSEHEPASETEAISEPESETKSEREEPIKGPAVLTYDNLSRLSSEKNVIFFLIDRFDVRYFEALLNSEPDFLDKLEGFTYYSDYTSLYCRTYPGIASILTGLENSFTDTRLNYFKEIYRDGGHLRALHDRGYTVNVYTEKYYAYDDAIYLSEYADNLATKGTAPLYDGDMKALYAAIAKEPFTLTEDKGQFSFIHLYGCHTPVKYNLNWDEATDKEKNDTTMALKQSFTVIYAYIAEMKRLGVYKDATIIITCDHPAALSDSKLIGEASKSDNGTRVTAMLFKPAGETYKELRISSAQISQDELWNTIYASEGLTALKTGDSFFDIPEGENRIRRYFFERSVKVDDGRADEIVEYRITGTARARENWAIKKVTVVGKIYK